eukprot:gene6567-7250_t
MKGSEDKTRKCKDPRNVSADREIAETSVKSEGTPDAYEPMSDRDDQLPDWSSIQNGEKLWGKIFKASWYKHVKNFYSKCLRKILEEELCPDIKKNKEGSSKTTAVMKDFQYSIQNMSSGDLSFITLRNRLSNTFTPAWMADARRSSTKSKKKHERSEEPTAAPSSQKRPKKTLLSPKIEAPPSGEKWRASVATPNNLFQESPFISTKKSCDNNKDNNEDRLQEEWLGDEIPLSPRKEAPPSSGEKRTRSIATSNIPFRKSSPFIWKKRCDNMYILTDNSEDVLHDVSSNGKDYADIEQLLEFLKVNSQKAGVQLLAFDNFDEVFISTEGISNQIDLALSSSKFRKEELLTHFFDPDLLFYELMLFYESLFEQYREFSSDTTSKQQFSLKEVYFRPSLISNINFQEVKQEFLTLLNPDNHNNNDDDLIVLVRQFADTDIYLVVRRFNDVVKTTFFIMHTTDPSPGYEEAMVVENCQASLASWAVILQLTREEGNSEFDDLVPCNLPNISYDSLVLQAKSQFKQIGNCSFQFFYNDELVRADASLEQYFKGANNVPPTFVIKLINDKGIDKGVLEEKLLSIASSNSFSLPIFRSQQLIASKLLEKAKEILSQKVFNAFNFRIFVPKYNTLRQQTIDRLGCFSDLVAGMTEKELTDHVILYPQSKSSSRTVEKFKTEILENPDTLFVIIVDECHFAPTVGAIDLLHDPEINENKHKNILTLLVSATPFNTLSKTSRISRENVINWSDIIHADLPDSYVGFEYFARTLAFVPCVQPKVNISISIGEEEESHHVFSLPNHDIKEYFGYKALTDELNIKLQEQLPNLSVDWVEKEFKFKITFKSQFDNKERKIIIQNNEFMKSLGFTTDIEINSKKGASTFSSEDVKIDSSNPVKHQLIRSDENFVELRRLLEAKFSFLKKTTTGEKDGITGKRINKRLNSIGKPSELFVYGGEEIKSRIMNVIHSSMTSSLPGPAIVKNGYIIVLDYILSIAFYAACFGGKTKTTDVSPRMVERYLEYLYLSCFHVEDRELFNLVDMLNVILEDMIKEGEKLLQAQTKSNIPSNSSDVMIYLKIVLEKKIAAYEKKDITIETYTWFTETDRIIFDLMDSKNTSPIVLLRCYDNDENRSMQKILRHCLEVCNLVGKNGERPFSIIGDISGTRILNEIEPYFLNLEIDHQEFQRCKLEDVPKLRSLKLQQDASSDLHLSKSKLVINDDIKYEDLRGIKCLLILCEKGRMGDTFPHSLMVLDLRLRTCRAGSGFIQEMGRMCRYPRYTEAVDEKKLQSFFGDRFDYMDVDYTDAEHSFEELFSNGCIVFNKRDQSFVGLARNEHQLNRLLQRISSRSVSAYSFHNLRDPLPYALIDDDYLEAIFKAGDEREAEIFANNSVSELQSCEVLRNKNRILEHLSCPFGIDDYVNQKVKKPSADFLYSLSISKEHYDLKNTDKLFNRMLLKAECQIGKTGAFLAFLYLLNASINSCPKLPPQIKPKTFAYQWYIPYWHNLTVLKQPPIEYGQPKLGKYHLKILMQRASLLKSLYTTSTAAQYIDQLIEVECIQVAGALTSLKLIADQFKLDQLQLSKIFESRHHQYLERLLNWDGRMSGKNSNGEAFEDLLLKLQGERGLDIIPNYKEENSLEHWMDVGSDLEVDENENAFDDDGRTFKPNDAPLGVELSTERQEDFSAKSLLQHFSNNGDNDDQQWKEYPLTWEHDEIRVSIPSRYGLDSIDDMIGKVPRIIKNWIFTPSYLGRSRLGEKLLMRTDCFPGLEIGEDYIQVLVVQKAQFDSYVKYYGAQYIVVQLPDSTIFDISSSGRKRYFANTGGVGYARRFIQEFATYYLGLKAIWMLDDNIKACYRLSIPKDYSQPVRNDSSNQLKYEATSFKEVMLTVEEICEFSSSSLVADIQWREESLIKAPDKVFRSIQMETNPYNDIGKVTSFRDYIGSTEKAYGIIGIARSLNQYQLIKEPIKVTHSVYSFFLFNLEAAAYHNLYYSPRPIWEDIEMIHMMEEKDLVVCKLQMFSHYKPPHGLRKPLELPKQPELIIESSKFCDLISELDNNFKIIVLEEQNQQSHDADGGLLCEVKKDLVEFYPEQVLFSNNGQDGLQNTENLIILDFINLSMLKEAHKRYAFILASFYYLDKNFGLPSSARKIIFIVPSPRDQKEVVMRFREFDFNILSYDVDSNRRIADDYILLILTRN